MIAEGDSTLTVFYNIKTFLQIWWGKSFDSVLKEMVLRIIRSSTINLHLAIDGMFFMLSNFQYRIFEGGHC